MIEQDAAGRGVLSHGEEAAGVSRADRALLEARERFFGELQEAQAVGDAGAALSELLGEILLGQAEFILEFLNGPGLFRGIEILALQIFHEGHYHDVLIGHGTDQHGHFPEPGQTGSAPAALARNDLIAAGGSGFAHDERLDDALAAYGRGEFLQGILRDSLAGLPDVRSDVRYGHEDRHTVFFPFSVSRSHISGNEGAEPSPQTLVHHCSDP